MIRQFFQALIFTTFTLLALPIASVATTLQPPPPASENTDVALFNGQFAIGVEGSFDYSDVHGMFFSPRIQSQPQLFELPITEGGQTHTASGFGYGVLAQLFMHNHPMWYYLANYHRPGDSNVRSLDLDTSDDDPLDNTHVSIDLEKNWQFTFGLARILLNNAHIRLSLGAGLTAVNQAMRAHILENGLGSELYANETRIAPTVFTQLMLPLSPSISMVAGIFLDRIPSISAAGYGDHANGRYGFGPASDDIQAPLSYYFTHRSRTEARASIGFLFMSSKA